MLHVYQNEPGKRQTTVLLRRPQMNTRLYKHTTNVSMSRIGFSKITSSISEWPGPNPWQFTTRAIVSLSGSDSSLDQMSPWSDGQC